MKNQSGRSMIEMLGVLAIIGVLSLGGVAVFNAVMNRHTANTLTYDVMLMAESTVSLGPQEQMPFDASTEYDQMSSVLVAGVANVIVNDVDKEICDILISKGGNGVFVLEKQADGSPLTDCDDEGTDIVFAFRDGYLPEAGVCNPSCDPGHICSNGQCCPNVIPEKACSIESTEACAGVTPPSKRDGTPCGENGDGSCQNGDCIEWDCSGNWRGENCDECNLNSSDCGTTQAVDEEHCLCVCGNDGYTGYYCSYSCPSATATSSVSGLSKSACEACGNAFWKDGLCYSCRYWRNISFDTEAEAEACENACAGTEYERVAVGTAVGTDCYPADKACPSATSSKWMSKSVCEECRNTNTVWSQGRCYGCRYSSTISFPTEAEAEACASACGRTAEGRYCYLANTNCPGSSYVSDMSKSDCDKCGNAFWKDGKCYLCEYSDSISFATEAEAKACASACAGSGYERIAEGRYCYGSPTTGCPSETESWPIMTKSTCEECSGTVWSDGDCYGCGYSGDIFFATEAEAEACVSACADRGYERVAVGTNCLLAEIFCPWETEYRPIMTKSRCEGCFGTVWSDGYCYFCGYSGSISFPTESEAEECENACAGSGYERIAEGRYCYRSPSTNCPLETTFTFNMTKSVCEGCDSAFWNDGGCYACRYSSSSTFATKAEAEACVSACADSGYPREVDKSGDWYYCSRK